MRSNIRNIYQLKAYLQVQRIMYLLMVLAYVKALKSREKPEILSTIKVPYAMAIDKYKNNIVVKGVDVELGYGLVHSSLINIIDVSNPQNPFITGTTDLGGYILDIKVVPDMNDSLVAVGGRVDTYGILDLVNLADLTAQFIYLSWNGSYGSPPLNVPYGGGQPREVAVLGTNAYMWLTMGSVSRQLTSHKLTLTFYR